MDNHRGTSPRACWRSRRKGDLVRATKARTKRSVLTHPSRGGAQRTTKTRANSYGRWPDSNSLDRAWRLSVGGPATSARSSVISPAVKSTAALEPAGNPGAMGSRLRSLPIDHASQGDRSSDGRPPLCAHAVGPARVVDATPPIAYDLWVNQLHGGYSSIFGATLGAPSETSRPLIQ